MKSVSERNQGGFLGSSLLSSLVRVSLEREKWEFRERQEVVVEGIYGTAYGDHLGRRVEAIRVKGHLTNHGLIRTCEGREVCSSEGDFSAY